MIFLSFILLGILSFISGELFLYSWLRWVGFSLVIIVSLALINEWYFLVKWLRLSLSGSGNFKDRRKIIFSITQSVKSECLTLLRRLKWAEDVVLQNSDCNTHRDSLLVGSQINSFDDLKDNLIQRLKKITSAVEIALISEDVVDEQNNSKETKCNILSSLAQDSRIREIHRVLLGRLTLSGNETKIISQNSTDFIERILNLQGFRSYRTFVLHGEPNSLHLWFGYDHQKGLLSKEEGGIKAEIQSFLQQAKSFEMLYKVEAETAAEVDKNDRKDAFLSHFSHDIRTPLNNIITVGRLLKTQDSVVDKAELLDMLLANCTRINQRIEEALDFSRHKSGNLSVNPESISFKTLGSDLYKTWLEAFTQNGLSFEVKFDELVSVFCDPIHLSRIIDNLLSNSLKYTDKGCIAIYGYCVKDDKFARIEVSDTGKGFLPEQIEDAFKPFNRLGLRDREGVGLGLPVTRVLAKENGGEVYITSVLGKGATVTVELPCFSHSSEGLENESSKKKGRVLLVDDDDDFRSLLQQEFESCGWEVVTAISFNDALSLIGYYQPDIVVTDFQVAEGNFQLFRVELERFFPKNRICIVSGYQLEGETQPVKGYTYFRKPLPLDHITNWALHAYQSYS
jgi:signal transduction histidine kinase